MSSVTFRCVTSQHQSATLLVLLAHQSPLTLHYKLACRLLPRCMFRRGGSSNAFQVGKAKKIHTTFPDGSELVEEYDAETHRIICKA